MNGDLKPKKKKENGNMKDRGLTLIELMITLAVLGVLAALAFPNVRDMIENRRLQRAAVDLSSVMQRAVSDSRTTERGESHLTIATTCAGYTISNTRLAAASPCDCAAAVGATGACQARRFNVADYTGLVVTLGNMPADGTLVFDSVRGMFRPTFATGAEPRVTLTINGKVLRVALTNNGHPTICTTTNQPGNPACPQ